MKKRLLCLLLTLITVLALCASVSAEQTSGPELDCVTDAAGLLTESEREQLEKMAEQVTQKYRVGVYIVTVGDYRDYNQDGVYKATYTIYHQYNMGEGPKRNGNMRSTSTAPRRWKMSIWTTSGMMTGTAALQTISVNVTSICKKPRTANPCGRAC